MASYRAELLATCREIAAKASDAASELDNWRQKFYAMPNPQTFLEKIKRLPSDRLVGLVKRLEFLFSRKQVGPDYDSWHSANEDASPSAPKTILLALWPADLKEVFEAVTALEREFRKVNNLGRQDPLTEVDIKNFNAASLSLRDAIRDSSPRAARRGLTADPSTTKSDTGVTIFDVAFAIEEDEAVATQRVKQWSDSKRIEAASIGKCPIDGRRPLYRLSEILSDIGKILSLNSEEKTLYRQALTAKLRMPRSN